MFMRGKQGRVQTLGMLFLVAAARQFCARVGRLCLCPCSRTRVTASSAWGRVSSKQRPQSSHLCIPLHLPALISFYPFLKSPKAFSPELALSSHPQSYFSQKLCLASSPHSQDIPSCYLATSTLPLLLLSVSFDIAAGCEHYLPSG